VEYTSNADCMSHYTLPKIVHLAEGSVDLTLEDLRLRAQKDLGSAEVSIEFSRDVVQKLVCPSCHDEEEIYRPLGSLFLEEAKCKNDGHLRTVMTLHSYLGETGLASRTLNQLGLPALDVFLARAGENEIGYIPYGDASLVLGDLHQSTTKPM